MKGIFEGSPSDLVFDVKLPEVKKFSHSYHDTTIKKERVVELQIFFPLLPLRFCRGRILFGWVLFFEIVVDVMYLKGGVLVLHLIGWETLFHADGFPKSLFAKGSQEHANTQWRCPMYKMKQWSTF